MARTVRPATVDDVQAIVGLGQQLFTESPRWGALTFSADRLATFLAELIEAEDGFVCVAEVEGVVVGAAMAFASQHYAADEVVASELALFVSPSHRRSELASILVLEMDAWARAAGAVWLQAGTSTEIEPERTAKLYESCGFRRIGMLCEVSYVHGR